MSPAARYIYRGAPGGPGALLARGYPDVTYNPGAVVDPGDPDPTDPPVVVDGVPLYPRIPSNGYEPGWENYPWAYLVPAGSSFVSPDGLPVIRSNSYSFGNATDLNVICPETWNTGLELRSGRNIHIFGGAIERVEATVENGHVPGYTSGYTGPGGAGQLALRINGRYTAGLGPRSFTWEGLHVKGEWTWEGANVVAQQDREPNQAFTFINYKVDQINVIRPASGGHLGGDALQNWNGFSTMRVIGADWRNLFYQGWFYQPLGDGSFSTIAAADLREFTLRHASLQGGSNHAQLLWDTMRDNATANANLTRVWDDIHVQSAPERTEIQSQFVRPEEFAKVALNAGAPSRLLLPAAGMGANYVHTPTP